MKAFIASGAAAFLLSACSAATDESAAQKSEEATSYGAYLVITGKNYEASDLGPYAASLPPIYAKYGGKYVAFTTDYDVAEGEFDAQAVIISGWPDAAAARAFWDSPEYAEAIKLREGIGEFTVVIVPALP